MSRETGHQGPSGWTDARVDKLKALYAEGLSHAQIAKRLGKVTRHAVGSKIDRLQQAGALVDRKPGEIRLRTDGIMQPLSARDGARSRFTPQGGGILPRTISEDEMKALGKAGQTQLARFELRWPVTGGTVLAAERRYGQCAFPYGVTMACGRPTVTNKGKRSNYCGDCFRRMYGKDAV